MQKESFSQGVIFMLLSATGLALTGLLGKFGLNYMDVTALIFWRYLTSFILCAFIMWGVGLFNEGFQVHNIKMHVLRAFLVLTSQYCYYFYLQKNTLLNAMVLINTGPLFIPIIERVFLKQKVGVSTWVSLAISFVGVLFVLQPDKDIFIKMSWIGLLAGITQGSSQIVFGINSKAERSDLGVLYLLFFCALFSLIPFLFMNRAEIPPEIHSPMMYWMLVGLGFASILNQLFRVIAYQHATPSKLSSFMYVSVLLAGVGDWLFFNDVPNAFSIMGAAFVVLGGILKIYLRFHILKRKKHLDK
jgi:drug/metabolite transporter (DMT)-like permease